MTSGRPRLPKGQAKGHIVPIRFSAKDAKRLTAAAKAEKQTVSDFIRGLVKLRLVWED